MDLVVRAREKGIAVKSIHNASIMNAVGVCGLQLYNFGQTVSIPFFNETWRPDSFYDKILANKRIGLHTMCLLDIKVKEQTIENLMRGRKIYEPPRYMSVAQAVSQLLEVEQKRGEGGTHCVSSAMLLCVRVFCLCVVSALDDFFVCVCVCFYVNCDTPVRLVFRFLLLYSRSRVSCH